jgi:DNA-binding Lrp family transcriptional regulator
MDETDKKISNKIQSDFPITSRPYREPGKRLDLSERQDQGRF